MLLILFLLLIFLLLFLLFLFLLLLCLLFLLFLSRHNFTLRREFLSGGSPEVSHDRKDPFPHAARDAVPRLRELSESGNEKLADAAEKALEKIRRK